MPDPALGPNGPGGPNGPSPASNDSAEARPAALVVSALPAREIARRLADSPGLDPVFVPRPLRCVPSLPRDTLGKLPRAALMQAFGRLRWTEEPAAEPVGSWPDEAGRAIARVGAVS